MVLAAVVPVPRLRILSTLWELWYSPLHQESWNADDVSSVAA